MTLSAGTRLGPYEILGPIGAGGMGEVYRARDPRLGRDVAIKVLPERVALDAEARARFEREARAVAALSHPNILAIHDLGVQGAIAYSVTEMLEGQTLRDRQGGASLPVRKAIDYGAQIARGLAAAHDKGVVHRDLKPENVFITDDGRAKILDFGLAKVDAAADSDLTSSPTVEMGTRPGTVLGTMGYMSPEQVRGQAVDHRSDLFAFGSILYEMLSGARAFRRNTAADTMSAILKEDPGPLSSATQEIPVPLQRIVDHCLEKNPAERFQSARDLAFHLEAIATASSSTAVEALPAAGAAARRSPRVAVALLAGLAAGLAIGALAATRLFAPEAPPPPTMRYISYSGHDSDPSASPDGRLIAYASVHGGRSQIWIKQHPGGDEVALTEGPADTVPRISPDGSQVLFARSESGRVGLFKMPVVGGEPRKIVDDAYEGDWSPDGSRVVFLRARTGDEGLFTAVGTVEANGQGSRDIATVERAQLFAPRWSPGGRTIVAVKTGTENAPHSLLLVPAGGGEPRMLTPPPPQGRLSAPAWLGDGALIYAQSESFAASTSEGGSGRIVRQEIGTGRAGVRMWLPLTASTLDRLGPSGIVMSVSARRQNLMDFTLAGGTATGKARWVTRGNSSDRQPVFSPDGQYVLFSSNRGGNMDLWKMSVITGAIRRITEDSADDWDPAFTPDGRSILWSTNRSGHFEIWICGADGTGARQLTQDGFDAENPTATPDGRWIVYNSGNPAQSGIWKIRPDGTEATRVLPGSWSVPETSPDGQHVAFRTAGSGTRTLHVARLDDGAAAIAPMDLPGSIYNARPRWMPDGRGLVFTGSDEAGARGIYVQDFAPGSDTTATRRPLMEFSLEETPESFGISPDGTRLIYSAADLVESLLVAQGIPGVTPRATDGR